jgi:hypothetical protein
MSWDKQVQKVVAKGNKALGFIRRNVGSCPEGVKKQAYLALPSQSVEYVFGDEGPKRCWHTQGEVGQAQGMLVSLPPLDMILHFYV